MAERGNEQHCKLRQSRSVARVVAVCYSATVRTRAAMATGMSVALMVAACASSPPPASPPAQPAGATGEADFTERLEKRVNTLERTVELLTVANQRLVEEVASLAETITAMTATRNPARRGPDPELVYSIPVKNNAFWGPADAKVTIVEAMEFACPACERARPFVDQLEQEFQGRSVRFVFKSFVVHPTRATLPATAACAAHMQGKYFDMVPLLWDTFTARKFDGKDDEQDVLDVAKKIAGIDMSQFELDMAGPCVDVINNDQAELRRANTAGTPTFFINGRVLTERTVDAVKKMVTEQLALADERIAAGAAQAQYYEEWIVAKGVTDK